ncbi:hypothetical protein [Candidatus Parabeggiatoa sp. HSG14]|uniref:hypothetical protein n=1 Tax=Candidatus Parabeggiatoa sp. HSG14 TaxID=3055593 RepID=UPI0025A6DEBB|nr:hypothetical protein [Thiotrichales bacterium HSG14]
MKKRVKLQTAILVLLASTAAYADESCLTNVGDKTPVDVFQCIEAKLNTQQNRITELEKENKRLRQKTDAFAVSSDGNVGIGTANPEGKLTVSGNISIQNSDFAGMFAYNVAGEKLIVQHHTALGPLIHAEADSFRLISQGATYGWDQFILKNGNIGIGTTNPSAKLDVNGSIVGNGIAGAWSASRTGGLEGPLADFATIPGLSITFTLERSAIVQTSGTGVQRTQTNSAGQTGYAFMVDGVHQGHGIWGQRIHRSCANAECHWQTWSISDTYNLEAGTHTIKLRARPDAKLAICAESNMTSQAYTDCELQILAVYQ